MSAHTAEKDALVTIRWKLDDDTAIEGMRGIDSERIAIRDLRKWAKKRQRQLRRDIRRAYRDEPANGSVTPPAPTKGDDHERASVAAR